VPGVCLLGANAAQRVRVSGWGAAQMLSHMQRVPRLAFARLLGCAGPTDDTGVRRTHGHRQAMSPNGSLST